MSLQFLKKGNPELMKRIEIVCGDGRLGYPKYAPYNAIHVGAAAPELPEAVSYPKIFFLFFIFLFIVCSFFSCL